MMFVHELVMNYHGYINLQERFISSKPINLEHYTRYLQHGKLLSTMFGGTFYCVRGDLFIKAKKKKTDSIWEIHGKSRQKTKFIKSLCLEQTIIYCHSTGYHELYPLNILRINTNCVTSVRSIERFGLHKNTQYFSPIL
ncbi:Hypothetical_protein [Hexamita inflata]|uniref:Hypothetical_protein n=1 Tax=Hexamita inflata TaxID=28002 RepID=A0AA86UMS6_9EUKA|nr:Hypothetical protein HINF_LOCUS52125 [Hexamita inflata]